jgi:hypothetical protein
MFVFLFFIDEIFIYKDACLPLHHYRSSDDLSNPNVIGEIAVGGTKSG